MPPTVIRMPASNYQQSQSAGGFNLGCCRVCTCLHLDFVTSSNGLIKLAEFVLGSFCQTLLIRFGMPAAQEIGQAFISFLTAVSTCLTTTAILIVCYVVSSKSYNLVRQSLFEVVFNTIACFLYWSAASYMGFSVNFFLYERFVMQNAYMAYPAMTAVYYMGFIVGAIYAADAFSAYKQFRGYR